MKKHSLLALLIVLLLLMGNLGSAPYGDDPQTEPTQVVYLPVVFQDYSPLPPAFSTSHYVQLDARISQEKRIDHLRTLGCKIGEQEQSIPGAQDHIVILALGKPWTTGPNYQVKFYRPLGVDDWVVVNVGEIDQLIQHIITGYWSCKDSGSTLTLAVGVNTFDTYGIVSAEGKPEQYVDEALGHGLEFARMLTALSDWVRNNGYNARITIAGALDSEVYFNDPMIARAWVDGYTKENNVIRYYNFGACEGCPTAPTTSWVGGNNWTQEDIWHVSWGVPLAWTIPEIYLTSFEENQWTYPNAIQWRYISWYSWEVHEQRIDFAGALTQNQACTQRGGCVYSEERTDIAPLEGWSALYNELNKDPVTAQSFLRWSSDMRWSIK